MGDALLKAGRPMVYSLCQYVNAGAGLYAVEPHEQFRGLYGGEFGPVDRGCFMRTMAETGLYEHVHLVNVSSEFLSDNWPMPVSLLYIDGDHRYEAVKRDFECWRGKLAAHAVIIFDDASNPSSGPGKLAREIASGGPFTLEVGVGKMLCLRFQPEKGPATIIEKAQHRTSIDRVINRRR